MLGLVNVSVPKSIGGASNSFYKHLVFLGACVGICCFMYYLHLSKSAEHVDDPKHEAVKQDSAGLAHKVVCFRACFVGSTPKINQDGCVMYCVLPCKVGIDGLQGARCTVFYH